MAKLKYRVFFKGEMYYLANSPMSELHLNLNNQHWGLFDGSKRNSLCTDKNGWLMCSTGFKDVNGKDIYHGDIIGDWNIVDGKKEQSKLQVFWNEPTGSWHLDQSFDQDKSQSTELWLELHDFKYKVIGNIHQKALAKEKQDTPELSEETKP